MCAYPKFAGIGARRALQSDAVGTLGMTSPQTLVSPAKWLPGVGLAGSVRVMLPQAFRCSPARTYGMFADSAHSAFCFLARSSIQLNMSLSICFLSSV